MSAGRTIEQLLTDFPYIEISKKRIFARRSPSPRVWLRGMKFASQVDAAAGRYEFDASLR
jgi:hypothetical protein